MMSEFCLIDNKITSVTLQQHNIMNMFQSEKIHLTKDQLPTCCFDILYHYTIEASIFNDYVNKTYDFSDQPVYIDWSILNNIQYLDTRNTKTIGYNLYSKK